MTKISKIEDIINDAKNGKMFLLVDSEDRENEGDLIIPAQKCSPESISFMAKYGRGLICLCLTEDRVKKLKLPLMNPNNWGKKTTAFILPLVFLLLKEIQQFMQLLIHSLKMVIFPHPGICFH